MKNFFSHDEGARNDPKLIKVLMRLGQAGKGVYWDIVEMLYEQDGYLLLSECESYAFALRTDCALLQSLINDFDLFKNDGERFWSESVMRRLSVRKEKSAKASASAASRWQNANGMRTHSESNANKGKEKKGEESKVEKNKERLGGDFVGADAPTTTEPISSLPSSPSMVPPSQQQPPAPQSPPVAATPPKPASQAKPDLETRREAFKESVRAYYRQNLTKYPVPMYEAFIGYWAESDGRKMRWEKEPVFEIPNRLSTWHQRDTKPTPIKTCPVNGSQRDARREPVPGTPFGKL